MEKIVRFGVIIGLLAALAASLATRLVPSADFGRPLQSSLGGMTATARNAEPDVATITLEVNGQPKRPRTLTLQGTTVKQVHLALLDGKPCVAVLTTGSKDAVRLYKVERGGFREFWRGISQGLNPWKVQIGDVDGDGLEEIAVGVYKKARFHPVMAKRPFIYGWDGRDVYPKWLGSRLSRPFTDFVLADFGSGVTRLVAVEETSNSANELAVYIWDGFGFTGEWRGARSKSLCDLAVLGSPGNHAVSVRDGRTVRKYIWTGSSLRHKEEAR